MIGWHILLPAVTVGFASCIAVPEGLFFFSGQAVWFRISEFWTGIFAVSLAMSVVMGIIRPFLIRHYGRVVVIALRRDIPMTLAETLRVCA